MYSLWASVRGAKRAAWRGGGGGARRLLGTGRPSATASSGSGDDDHAIGGGVHLSHQRSTGGWADESPAGGATELWVYRGAARAPTRWPDPALGVLASDGATDARFALPGNVGTSHEDALPPLTASIQNGTLEVIEPSIRERQAQVLLTASDYYLKTTDAASYACSDLLPELPAMRLADDLKCAVHQAPMLLKKESQALFPKQGWITSNPSSTLTVVTVAQRTLNDMSAWSDAMEEEREERVAAFVGAAKEICARLASEGLWADFIDPSSGTPFHSGHAPTTMFETDEKYRLLGFRVEDLGCCKVLCDRDFGRNVLVGSIFTNAHASNPVIEETLHDLRLPNMAKSDDDGQNP